MTYATAQALRMALEQRLLRHSTETGISLDRLRRRVVFERIIARLQSAEPGVWVLKGGMALEVRLHDDARLTKDLDLGLRTDIADAEDLQPRRLREDVAGRPTWRARTRARLAGKDFGSLQLDISRRTHELDDTDVITLPNSLEFAGIAPVEVEIVDVHRHAAEKLHAMVRDFDERENSRVRDLVDIVISSNTAYSTHRGWVLRSGRSGRNGARLAVRIPLGAGPDGGRHRRALAVFQAEGLAIADPLVSDVCAQDGARRSVDSLQPSPSAL